MSQINGHAVEKPLETVPVTDISQVMGILIAWHENRLKRLDHMKTIPEGTQFQREEGKVEVLEGDLLAGFILGLHVARAEIENLPFAIEVVPEVAQDSNTPSVEMPAHESP